MGNSDPGAVRALIAEALRWADAHGMMDVGLYLDRALVAFDEAARADGAADGLAGHAREMDGYADDGAPPSSVTV